MIPSLLLTFAFFSTNNFSFRPLYIIRNGIGVSRAREYTPPSEFLEKFNGRSSESRSVPLERSKMIVFRLEKQLPSFRFPSRRWCTVCTSSTCCRRPSTKRSRHRHFRVKVQRTYSASRTATFAAHGGGWHIRVRQCICRRQRNIRTFHRRVRMQISE